MADYIRQPDVSTVARELQHLIRALEVEPQNAYLHIQRGMAKFRLGDITAAIDDFDRAEQLDPTLTPYLWQRGIAYYYAERFEDGAKQFEADLTVNGHDVEETVWRYLCQAQMQGVDAACRALFPVGDESRPVMRWVYRLFAGTCQPEALTTQYQNAGRRERFYSALYVGLYFEAERQPQRAREFIGRAVDLQLTEDYMAWVAMVHQRLRRWTSE
jgi:tetratricopeptide (TPR) repeat protein